MSRWNEVNELTDWEGLQIPAIENLASHQGTYDTLNLTDNSITALGNIPLCESGVLDLADDSGDAEVETKKWTRKAGGTSGCRQERNRKSLFIMEGSSQVTRTRTGGTCSHGPSIWRITIRDDGPGPVSARTASLALRSVEFSILTFQHHVYIRSTSPRTRSHPSALLCHQM